MRARTRSDHSKESANVGQVSDLPVTASSEGGPILTICRRGG